MVPQESPSQARFAEIMQRHNARGTVRDFHHAVNVTFHENECGAYDREHQSMWDSLPQQLSLLVDDWLDTPPHPPEEIHVLDIGCGTGLAAHSLIHSPIGYRIRSVTLLDTSPAMLQKASERASQWKIPCTCHLGSIESLAHGQEYGLIVTCSVLHHIPDLAAFFAVVRSHQAGGGVFMHLQDPNGDYLNDAELQQRMARFSGPPEWLARFLPSESWAGSFAN